MNRDKILPALFTACCIAVVFLATWVTYKSAEARRPSGVSISESEVAERNGRNARRFFEEFCDKNNVVRAFSVLKKQTKYLPDVSVWVMFVGEATGEGVVAYVEPSHKRYGLWKGVEEGKIYALIYNEKSLGSLNSAQIADYVDLRLVGSIISDEVNSTHLGDHIVLSSAR